MGSKLSINIGRKYTEKIKSVTEKNVYHIIKEKDEEI